MNRIHSKLSRTSIGTAFYMLYLNKYINGGFSMFGFLSICILLFTVAVFTANSFLQMMLFQGETALFIVGILPLFGVIFGIWSNGIVKFIGIFGNLTIFVVATISPLYLYFF